MMGSVLSGWMRCCDSVISLDDRECEIFRASADSERATVIGSGAFLVVSAVPLPFGEDALLTSMCCSAAWSSRRLPMLRPRSSSSEESGGVVIAPDGIRRSFTGEGDWRKLPLLEEPRERLASDADPAGPFTTWPFAAVLSAVADEGVRRCLFRYDVDETERGSAGRCEATGESGLGSM
jgi:hypothetical protein